MPTYHITLKKRLSLAHNTIGYIFDKPADLTFKAGQFGSFTLLNPVITDLKSKMRSLSIASPPYADELMIATRWRDSIFKNELEQLPLGSQIKFNASYGTFTLHADSQVPAVYITGGIGIAPVRSIVLQAAQEKLAHPITLFYANRRPEDAPFLQELIHLANDNPYYQFIGTMTQAEKSIEPWDGETGYINTDMLLKYISAPQLPLYYVVGPSAMVKAVRHTLAALGIDETHIRTEEFPGY